MSRRRGWPPANSNVSYRCEGGKRAVIGSDGTYVKVKGQEVGVQVVVDDHDSALLGLEIIVSGNAEEVLSWSRAIYVEFVP